MTTENSVGSIEPQTTTTNWTPNTAECQLCGVAFGYMFNRPHHCRICGSCVCNACSQGTVIDARGVAHRICSACKGETVGSLENPSTLDQALKTVLEYAIHGVPMLKTPSCSQRASRYLEKYQGDVTAAIQAAITKNHSFSAKLTRAVVSSLPFVGIPPAIIMPLWRQLREIALIAALYKHDVESEEVKQKILRCLILDSALLPISSITAAVATRAVGNQISPIISRAVTAQAATNIGENIIKTVSEKAATDGITVVGMTVGGSVGGAIVKTVAVSTGADTFVGNVAATVVGTAVKTEVGQNLVFNAAKHSAAVAPASAVGTVAVSSLFGLTVGIPFALLLDYLTDKSEEIFEFAGKVFCTSVLC